MDEYNTGGIDRPSRSSLIHPLGLTDAEKQDLIAFMNTLTERPDAVRSANTTPLICLGNDLLAYHPSC